MSTLPQTRYARSSGDARIAYQVVGGGPIDLVFVSGLVSNVEGYWEDPVFAPFFERLASFARVLAFDKRVPGFSDFTPEPSTLEQTTDEAPTVLDAAGME